MRRMVVLIVGLVALVAVAAAITLPTGNADRAKASVVAATEPPPEPLFTRTTYGVTNLAGADAMLDVCKGPVAVFLGDQRPTLIAEHDYCGGMFWIAKVKVGDAVMLKGRGVDDGIFVVTSLTYETRHEVSVGDLPEGDLVLQTCISKTRLVLAALERFDA